LPVAVEEAALVDNVPRLRIFFEIVLPMARPGLIATFLISLGFVWNEFLFALILTSGEWQTVPIAISGQNSVRGTEWWSIAAASLIAVTPMMVLTGILARMMRSGVMLGAIK
jgi:multiple sugar transport system permease protein